MGATFVAILITFGNLKALGVLLLAMQNDFDSDVWIIGWMAVMYNSVSYISGKTLSIILTIFVSGWQLFAKQASIVIRALFI